MAEGGAVALLSPAEEVGLPGGGVCAGVGRRSGPGICSACAGHRFGRRRVKKVPREAGRRGAAIHNRVKIALCQAG